MGKPTASVQFICPDCFERARALPHALGRVRCKCGAPLVLAEGFKAPTRPARAAPRHRGPKVAPVGAPPLEHLTCRRCGRLYRAAEGERCVDCDVVLIRPSQLRRRRRRWERPAGAPGLGKRR